MFSGLIWAEDLAYSCTMLLHCGGLESVNSFAPLINTYEKQSIVQNSKSDSKNLSVQRVNFSGAQNALMYIHPVPVC